MAEKIGETLVRIGAMTHKQVDAVLSKQRAGDKRLFGEIAIENGFINDGAIKAYLEIKEPCGYSGECHFYSIQKMTPANQMLKDLYCFEWPEKCAIYHQKNAAKPVPITLWPTGMLAAASFTSKS